MFNRGLYFFVFCLYFVVADPIEQCERKDYDHLEIVERSNYNDKFDDRKFQSCPVSFANAQVLLKTGDSLETRPVDVKPNLALGQIPYILVPYSGQLPEFLNSFRNEPQVIKDTPLIREEVRIVQDRPKPFIPLSQKDVDVKVTVDADLDKPDVILKKTPYYQQVNPSSGDIISLPFGQKDVDVKVAVNDPYVTVEKAGGVLPLPLEPKDVDVKVVVNPDRQVFKNYANDDFPKVVPSDPLFPPNLKEVEVDNLYPKVVKSNPFQPSDQEIIVRKPLYPQTDLFPTVVKSESLLLPLKKDVDVEVTLNADQDIIIRKPHYHQTDLFPKVVTSEPLLPPLQKDVEVEVALNTDQDILVRKPHCSSIVVNSDPLFPPVQKDVDVEVAVNTDQEIIARKPVYQQSDLFPTVVNSEPLLRPIQKDVDVKVAVNADQDFIVRNPVYQQSDLFPTVVKSEPLLRPAQKDVDVQVALNTDQDVVIRKPQYQPKNLYSTVVKSEPLPLLPPLQKDVNVKVDVNEDIDKEILINSKPQCYSTEAEKDDVKILPLYTTKELPSVLPLNPKDVDLKVTVNADIDRPSNKILQLPWDQKDVDVKVSLNTDPNNTPQLYKENIYPEAVKSELPLFPQNPNEVKVTVNDQLNLVKPPRVPLTINDYNVILPEKKPLDVKVTLEKPEVVQDFYLPVKESPIKIVKNPPVYPLEFDDQPSRPSLAKDLFINSVPVLKDTLDEDYITRLNVVKHPRIVPEIVYSERNVQPPVRIIDDFPVISSNWQPVQEYQNISKLLDDSLATVICTSCNTAPKLVVTYPIVPPGIPLTLPKIPISDCGCGRRKIVDEDKLFGFQTLPIDRCTCSCCNRPKVPGRRFVYDVDNLQVFASPEVIPTASYTKYATASSSQYYEDPKKIIVCRKPKTYTYVTGGYSPEGCPTATKVRYVEKPQCGTYQVIPKYDILPKYDVKPIQVVRPHGPGCYCSTCAKYTGELNDY